VATASTITATANDSVPAVPAHAVATCTPPPTTSCGRRAQVGFEGARDRIIAVPKKMNMVLWLFCGDEAKSAKQRSCMKAFMLTPIFAVSGILSIVGLFIALAHDIQDKRWYWLFVCSGAWLWLVS